MQNKVSFNQKRSTKLLICKVHFENVGFRIDFFNRFIYAQKYVWVYMISFNDNKSGETKAITLRVLVK